MSTINFGTKIEKDVNEELKKIKVRILEKTKTNIVLVRENEKFEINLDCFQYKKERLKQFKTVCEFEKIVERNIVLNRFKLSSWKTKAKEESKRQSPNKSRLQFYISAASGYKNNLRYDELRLNILIAFKMKLIATIEGQTRKKHNSNEKTI